MSVARMKNRFVKTGVFILVSVVLAALLGCGGVSYRYYTAGWFGRLKPGIPQERVKELLGAPTGVERRQISPDDLREVWIYHVKNLDPRNHLYPSLHFIVFSNGKMIWKDPKNPYAPLPTGASPQETPPAS